MWVVGCRRKKMATQVPVLGLFVETTAGYINMSAVVHIESLKSHDYMLFIFAGSESDGAEDIHPYEVSVPKEEGQEILSWLKEVHAREHGEPPYQTKAVIEQERPKKDTAE
jgi:hypothetical protein